MTGRVAARERQFGFLRTKVVGVDLDAPVRTIRGLDGYTLALVLVRWGGEPIGAVQVPVHGDRCPGTVVADAIVAEFGPALLRTRLLALLECPEAERRLDVESAIAATPGRARAHSGSAATTPSMTVAVCTHDRPALLERCLAALRSLPAGVRVLVVDNAPSTDASSRLVAASYPGCDYVLEPRPGLDHARNRAIAETTSDVLAFTDDDAVVDDGWAHAVARAFREEPELGALTGLVLPYEIETPAQELFERLGGFGRGFVRRWETEQISSGRPRTGGTILGAGEFGTGANMAFRRTVFDRIGGFDPALDVGTPARGGGDLEMFHRVLAGGQLLLYEPAAIVFHQHRRTFPELEAQLYDHGSQWAMMMSARAGGRAATADVRSVLSWYLTKHWPRLLLRAALIPNRVPLTLPFAEVQGMAAAGVDRWYRRSRFVNPDPPVPPIPTEAHGAPHAPQLDSRTAVVTVDVAGTIALSESRSGSAALSVLVTRGHAAIGRLHVETGGRTPSDRLLRELLIDDLGVRVLEECATRDHDDVRQEVLSRLAEAFRRDAEADLRDEPYRVSIVVASLDRPHTLRECLESLCRHRSRHEVEIVVVDNNPASGLTASVLDEHPNVVRVTEPRRGLAYARNAGFLAASGAILVTTDDDVQVPEGWLDLLLTPFQRNDVMAVCGNVQPIELRHPAQVDFEAMGGLGKGFDRVESSWESPGSAWRSFRAWDLGATANAAFRAEFLTHPEIGLMDEALGPGMPSGVGEDSYLLYRIVRAGYTVVYEPTAFVYHRHRSGDDDLNRQLTAYYSGHVAHNLTTLIRDRDLRALVRLSGFAAYVTGTRLRSLAGRGRTESARAQVRGAAAGPLNYFRSQQRVRQQGRSGPGATQAADMTVQPS